MIGATKDRSGAHTDGVDVSRAGWTENSLRVLKTRYLKKNDKGECVESVTDMLERVARAIADIELLYHDDPANRSEWQDRFYSMMLERRFMPNSPTLMNAGREMGLLSACFVLPVGDSINEIFDAIKHTALIQKAGGGTGFAFDELRPTGDYIKSSGGTTSGPISFWRAFSEATNAIQQGAFRRGANMGMMYIHHPDVLKFLHAKQKLDQFTNYNISVKVTDAWMQALRDDPQAPHVVRNPRNGDEYFLPKDLNISEYDIRNLVPAARAAERPDRAPFYSRQDIWDIITKHAWQTGEPGVVFIDRINQDNPTPQLGRIEATNPCGEQPLLPYEACNLGSVNLSAFVRQPSTEQADMDWEALGETIDTAVRFLDNVIDANRYPLPQIEQMCKGNRKIGLGVMGFADALYKLGVGYNTAEGLAWGERCMKFLSERCHAYSEELAEQRGCFPNWRGSLWDTRAHRPMRNACCTTVAPTGTISIIAGCSCGIEPLFGVVFYRNVLRGQDEDQGVMLEVNPVFERTMRQRDLISEGTMDRIARDGTLAQVSEIPEAMKRVFVCANDVTPEWHVKMQAAFQRHCDSSISKTINFPNDATVEQVAGIYEMCYDSGCKGVTVYRDGCRSHQPMTRAGETQEDSAEVRVVEKVKQVIVHVPREPQPVEEFTSGIRMRQMTPFGNMHVHITVDPHSGRELEVFAQLGKGGDLANSDLEAICRLVSLWLRSHGELHHVIAQLKGIGSSLQVSTREGKIMSLGDGLARALARYAHAKMRVGTRALLLGECDWSQVDQAKPGSANGGNGKENGNGNGNGNGQNAANESVDSISQQSRTVRHGGAAEPLASSTDASGPRSQLESFKVLCPDCQGPVRFSEGCVTCEACGYAQC
ncbi:MAG: vitamin B12-dependent ribonucleotide reductase [bacterium]|nr:vitamin B12-dependent ribonucleotide reductase [bacterium]